MQTNVTPTLFHPPSPVMGLFLFFLLFISVQAVVVSSPSNTTDIRIQSTGFLIEGNNLTGQKLIPLTQSLIESTTAHLKTFNYSGTATQVIPSNSLDLKGRKSLAYLATRTTIPEISELTRQLNTSPLPNPLLPLSCTAKQLPAAASIPMIRPLNVIPISSLSQADPAILHYSVLSINQQLSASSQCPPTSAVFLPTGMPVVQVTVQTRVPMIILYSITGIITALFLGIIITGAVRAHRHPERYGPRRIAGRVRQSRARGLARAMLDTIPVVKFDDKNDDVEAAKRDVEMMGAEDAREPSPQDGNTTGVSTTRESEIPTPDDHERPTPTPTAPEAKTEMPETGNFSCPICTDDFIKGQDLRVLPCNHQFHMECIDPWLMNVSGTCPLCRIDLNPPQPEDPEQTEENADQYDQSHVEGAVLTTEDARQQARQQARHTHRRLTNYLHGPLNARRMRDATVEERLAALRRVREANQVDSAPEEGVHRGLTTRLRDRFRIRTRAHGAEGETSADADHAAPSPASPASPAVVHLTPSTA
ncbi:Zinc finger RING-type [Penicillium cf. griseofulvum]|nr:Zinc finger RING-type [Penicillium cf. griseofulvum]